MKTPLILALAVVVGVAGIAVDRACAVAGLSRGENILLQRGLQIQTLSDPQVSGEFNSTLWAQSYFTTIHLGYYYPAALMPTSSRPAWGLTSYNNLTTLSSADQPYASSLVSLQYGDEQALDATECAVLAPAMAAFHVSLPNVLTYTDQYSDPVGGQAFSLAVMQNYMQTVKPDMLCFNCYPFQGNVVGGSPTSLYSNLEYYRKLGIAGNDGTGAQPIPVGIYTQEFVSLYAGNSHVVSESEIRLNTFAAWAFGCKFVDRFTYETFESDIPAVMFSGSGTANPTPQFYQVAETNRQSLNLGPALVRLVSTDTRMILGQNKQGSSNVQNALPSGVSSWDSSAGTTEKYITSISATNLGTTNSGLPGDVLVGYFKLLDASFTNSGHADDTYFMIVNGLSDANGSAADCRQEIDMTFDFGTSGIDSLLRLSRDTGLVEQLALVHDRGSLYHLDLILDGGTGDLFKFDDGGTFILPEPGTLLLCSGGLTGLFAYGCARRKRM